MPFARVAAQCLQQLQRSGTRGMASATGKGVTYEGVTIQPASTKHVVASEILGGLMWSWLLIRLYEDGETLLFGHVPHLEHELHMLQHNEEHEDEH